jgi:hypothetical protein
MDGRTGEPASNNTLQLSSTSSAPPHADVGLCHRRPTAQRACRRALPRHPTPYPQLVQSIMPTGRVQHAQDVPRGSAPSSDLRIYRICLQARPRMYQNLTEAIECFPSRFSDGSPPPHPFSLAVGASSS